MLPLWRDRLHVVLTPEHVTIVRLGKGLKPRETFNKTLSCATPEEGEPAWQPALRVLKQLLQQAGSGKADAVVLLSNHFVRYQLVEAQPDLANLDEEQGFVRFSFAEVYGSEAEHWSMRWAAGLDLTSQVASAVDQALIDQMEKVLTAASVKLISLQPYLMAAFNYVRESVDARPLWFVLAEPGRACVGLLRDGDWQTLRSVRLGADWAADLPRVIEREFQMIGPEIGRGNMLLCLPAYFDHKRLASECQSLRILTMTPEMLQRRAVLPVANVEVK